VWDRIVFLGCGVTHGSSAGRSFGHVVNSGEHWCDD